VFELFVWCDLVSKEPSLGPEAPLADQVEVVAGTAPQLDTVRQAGRRGQAQVVVRALVDDVPDRGE
jgi:hypothetical protein